MIADSGAIYTGAVMGKILGDSGEGEAGHRRRQKSNVRPTARKEPPVPDDC